MSAKFILHPEDLSVVVASNLNADILSDLGSAALMLDRFGLPDQAARPRRASRSAGARYGCVFKGH
ncbi:MULTISPECIES: hypothetical protein [unclassified Streptomyces]|uniref:hypothetical protein n=1 Tax=unclassified Streptomyces TaxID=2593676 RepID=UPI003076DAC6